MKTVVIATVAAAASLAATAAFAAGDLPSRDTQRELDRLFAAERAEEARTDARDTQGPAFLRSILGRNIGFGIADIAPATGGRDSYNTVGPRFGDR